MKYVIVVPDGMADRPVKELGGRTPLEAARTPNMDFIAHNGSCGLAKTFYPGLPYDSSIANMSILGYDPRKYFSGRSPLEAANMGVALGEGDVALRCNLVTLEGGRMKDFTAGHIRSEEAAQLIGELECRLGGGGVEFHPGVSYRHLLIIRSSLKPSVDFTAKPPHDIIGAEASRYKVKAKSPSAAKTVELLNRLQEESSGVLAGQKANIRRDSAMKNPANSIWLWGAGVKPDMPSFESKFGIKGSLVSAVDLLKGLGRTIGMDVISVEGATGYLDTNYEGKADAAVESLKKADLTYVHLESTDEAGHEGSVEHKIKAIEDIDRRVLGRILSKLAGDYRILLMPDHATPVSVKTHTTEPVPYAFYSVGSAAGKVDAFSESEIRKKCAKTPSDAYKLMGRLIGAKSP
jgi:2,3-bisphosphoglycerate-independent phosphoglycerate mutase